MSFALLSLEDVMTKSVGIAAFGTAIGVPFWGIGLVVVGLVAVGGGIGYVIGGSISSAAAGAGIAAIS